MNRRKLVLFDIDGTLLLSRGAGRRAVLAAMAGLLPPEESVRGVRFDGKTDPQIVAELLAAAGAPDAADPARVSRILDRYVEVLEQELARPGHVTDVMPGVPQVLDRIEQAHEAMLGLLTGNVRPGARLKLRSAAIDPDRFPVGAFGSDHPVRAELPAIAAVRAEPHFGRRPAGAEIVIIGDTPADVTCGLAVGARALGVATGGYSASELADAGAYAVFEDLSDLDLVWQAIWA
jgi:phosphoglycolate phosphatase-like HAD superfamily hydrolase